MGSNLGLGSDRAASKQYQIPNDMRWVSQDTTFYYGLRCQKIDNMFRPFSIRPSSGPHNLTKTNEISFNTHFLVIAYYVYMYAVTM